MDASTSATTTSPTRPSDRVRLLSEIAERDEAPLASGSGALCYALSLTA